ncbi:uncharacterized protein [Nicotiana sylvestris]|uniref:uncharacterized protein n=1 Tax=Nicotiana sylvestris TaxID=4096 RepID=UPI00388C52A5
MALYEASYGIRCYSLIGFEPGKAILLGTDLVCDALEKVKSIQERLRIAQSRQKSYDDWKVFDVAFMDGAKVLLRVLPMKGVMRFGNKCKLSPQYISPFEVLERVGELEENLSYEEESVASLDR